MSGPTTCTSAGLLSHRPIVDGAVMSPHVSSTPVNAYGNTYGYFANYGYANHFSSVPPPLVSYDSPSLSAAAENTVSPPVQDKPPVQAPFWICFVKGNISRCNGCKRRIGRLPPLEDIVLQHKEKVLLLNPHTGNYQLSRDLHNVYHHTLKDCVCAHFNDFDADVHIKVDYSVKVLLSDVHVQHMLDEFNLHL